MLEMTTEDRQIRRTRKPRVKAPDNQERVRAVPLWQSDCKYTWLTDLSSFQGIPEDVEYVSVDLETTGLDRFTDLIVGLSFSFKKGEAFYISVRHIHDKNISEGALLEFLNKHFKDKTIVYWNARFDRGFLKRLGFIEKSWKDAAIYSYVHDIDVCAELSGSLKAHCSHYLKFEMIDIRLALGMPKRKQRNEAGIDFAAQKVDDVILAYACADADITLRLFKGFKKALDAKPGTADVLTLDHRVLQAVDFIEDSGIRVDQKYTEQLKETLLKENEGILSELQNSIDPEFNPLSNKDLGNYFYNVLKMPVMKYTAKGAPSTDKYVLETLGHQYEGDTGNVGKILKFKKNLKSISTYVDPVLNGINPRTGCVHPNYHCTKTTTGRFSGGGDGVYLKKFNGQNIPKGALRQMFAPRPGHTWVSIDLSNIEVRIIAQYSGDKALLEMFKRGDDMHDFTTKLMFKVDKDSPEWEDYRKLGKTMNFNLAYAFGITRMQEKLKCSEEEAWNYYNLYFRQSYRQWGNWKEATRQRCRRDYLTSTYFGRSRSLEPYYKLGKGQGDRRSVNYPIQGTCADLLRYAMYNCYKYIKKENLFGKVYMCGTIHDELTFSIEGKPGDEFFESVVKKLKATMEYTPKGFILPVKAEVSVGPSWGEVKKYEVVNG